MLWPLVGVLAALPLFNSYPPNARKHEAQIRFNFVLMKKGKQHAQVRKKESLHMNLSNLFSGCQRLIVSVYVTYGIYLEGVKIVLQFKCRSCISLQWPVVCSGTLLIRFFST